MGNDAWPYLAAAFVFLAPLIVQYSLYPILARKFRGNVYLSEIGESIILKASLVPYLGLPIAAGALYREYKDDR